MAAPDPDPAPPAGGAPARPPVPAAAPPAPPSDPPDPWLRRFREYVTAAIALLIVVGTAVMVGIIFRANVASWERVKDLLLFVNPILGVVIGYYFGKVPAEAQADTARAQAKSAEGKARAAQADKKRAQAEKKEALVEKKEATERARKTEKAVRGLVDANDKAEAALAKMEAAPVRRGPGTLSDHTSTAESAPPAPAETAELRVQMRMAREEALRALE